MSEIPSLDVLGFAPTYSPSTMIVSGSAFGDPKMNMVPLRCCTLPRIFDHSYPGGNIEETRRRLIPLDFGQLQIFLGRRV
jgi:hypothetical protein